MLCSYAIVPLLILFLVIIFSVELNKTNYDVVFSHRFNFTGTSLVISSLIASVIDFPTFFRHSRSKKDSVIALVVVLVVTIVIQCLGLFLYHIFLIDNLFIAALMEKNFTSSIFISAFFI